LRFFSLKLNSIFRECHPFLNLEAKVKINPLEATLSACVRRYFGWELG
jgi:hypothetical protein